MFITFNEGCKELGVKPSTLYQWVAAGLVPVIRVGRLLRFDKEQLLIWFKNGDFEKARREKVNLIK